MSAALATDTDSPVTFIKQWAAVSTMLLVTIDPLHVLGPWMTKNKQTKKHFSLYLKFY